MFNAVLYTFAIVGLVNTLAQVPRVKSRLDSRKYDERMRRITKLEVELGIGLSFSTKAWLETRKPIYVSNRKYAHIAVIRCNICGKEFQRNAASENYIVICSACRFQIADSSQSRTERDSITRGLSYGQIAVLTKRSYK